MLVEKNKFEGQVASIKLVTGEEVIARVQSFDGDFRVLRPLSMVMMAGDSTDQGMVAFAPWALGLDDDAVVTFRAAHVVHAGIARADAAQQYSEAVGENLQRSVGQRGANTGTPSASRGRR